MGSIPKFAHVVFQTGRLEQMRDWYCDLLEGHAVYQGHGLCFVTFDDEHHRVAFMQPPVPMDPKAPTAAGMHHTAYTFDDLDALLERYTSLKDKGIEPAVPIQHGVTTSLYYRDPDGNFVELQVDNFEAADDATAYMEGEEYDQDPVGVSFSPDLMIAERRSGVPAEQLQTRKWALTTTPDLPNPLTVLTS
ncbi:VOC family protein [Pseudonocardia xishanensis]|uniref:VOC family protein n=1 Tax=Pseudonocardia xishanensis TaxID=630995 RepID=A0ABP8S3E8_9PSEU